MLLEDFLLKLNSAPDSISFNDTMAVIAENYRYSPAEFSNGTLLNLVGENEGSCKIFAFAQLQKLNDSQTLACFGDYYRHDVLDNPDGTNHQNIRNFMQTGWDGIEFKNNALTAR